MSRQKNPKIHGSTSPHSVFDSNHTTFNASLNLAAAVTMGTGGMIGSGKFALTGQVAESAVTNIPLAFLTAASISGFSAHSCIKVTRMYPSAGEIAMILGKAHDIATMTGACAALLMALSMVTNVSTVGRTFET